MLIYINQLNNHTHLIIIMKGGKAIFLLIHDDISIQESSKEINEKVDFCERHGLWKQMMFIIKRTAKIMFSLEKIKRLKKAIK